jgi:hypothetical protein
LKELIAPLKNTIPDFDAEQPGKTTNKIDKFYSDSRQADVNNLNLNQADESMNRVSRMLNSNK